jgi:alpha-beta hydrolase superfamily lysophospholipase
LLAYPHGEAARLNGEAARLNGKARPPAQRRQTEELSMADLDWRPDILGDGYSQAVLDLGTDPDGEGSVEAVLVRREPGAGDAVDEDPAGQDPAGDGAVGVVLYVCGFTDYFFQRELADFFAARGLRFYALDPRKCGRARKPGQTAHYVSDLALYDKELDRALDSVTAAHPGLPVIMVAHSTGGLIVSLWLSRRLAASPATGIVALVLNSPWLELQGGALLRGPVTQVLRVAARARPFQVAPLGGGVYGQTLHVTGTGEWDYDLALKPLAGFPVTLGWINAIRRAQARLHHGIETGLPTLVLRSTRSDLSGRRTAISDRADLVLDTVQIGQWEHSLGGQVTDVPITDARHDVFLSVPEVRASAYAALSDWLARQGLGRPAAVGNA